MPTLSFSSIAHALELFRVEADAIYVDKSAVPELFSEPPSKNITRLAPDRFRVRTDEHTLTATLVGNRVRFEKSAKLSTKGSVLASSIAGGLVGGILGAIVSNHKKGASLAGALVGAALWGAAARKQAEQADSAPEPRLLHVDDALNVQAENLSPQSRALYLYFHDATDQWIACAYEEPAPTPNPLQTPSPQQ